MQETNLKAELYKEKSDAYFSTIKWPIVELIPQGDHKILDVGCGAGSTLGKLKELGKAGEIVGIEINEKMAKNSSNNLDELYVGDVETMCPPRTERYFDYILFADVLEHLIDPWKVLHDYKRLLKDNGYVIATIPTIKHYSVLIRLILLDEFPYAYGGILDRSHLRFFTKKEIIKMFQYEGFEVVQLVALPVREKLATKNARDVLLEFSNRLLNKIPFRARGYLIKVKKQRLQDKNDMSVINH